MKESIITAGGFDNFDFKKVRFIHEASKMGRLIILLFGDVLIKKLTGTPPKYPLPERVYFAENIRYVDRVHMIRDLTELQKVSELIGGTVDAWISFSAEELPEFHQCAQSQGIAYRVISEESLTDYQEHDYDVNTFSGKKAIVTGCFDWFHTGHVRFFEEASQYGDLYVILGHDKNLKELKGPGHPMFSEDERRYMAGSIRFVKQALISSGNGWLDAEPEIEQLKPDIYVVNEDGDKDIKRRYCESHGIQYLVLKREPKPGLERRTSTHLRGF